MTLRTVAVSTTLLFVLGCAERDWNPHITDASALVGEWTDGSAKLTLVADGTYRCDGGSACVPLGSAGRWERKGDFYLRLLPAEHTALEWRLSELRGYLQLASGNTDGDPDSWSPVLTFRHRRPAT